MNRASDETDSASDVRERRDNLLKIKCNGGLGGLERTGQFSSNRQLHGHNDQEADVYQRNAFDVVAEAITTVSRPGCLKSKVRIGKANLELTADPDIVGRTAVKSVH